MVAGPGRTGRGRRTRSAVAAVACALIAALGALAPKGAGAASPSPPSMPTAPPSPSAPASPRPPLAPTAGGGSTSPPATASGTGATTASATGAAGAGAAATVSGTAATVSGTAGAGTAGAMTAAALVAQALRRLPTARLDGVLEAVARQAAGTTVPSLGATLAALARGRMPLSPQALLAAVARALGRELATGAALLGKLVVLAVGAALLDLVGRGLGRDEAARLGAKVVELALVALALGSFTVAFALARGVVADLNSLMEAVLPLMVGLLAAMGAVTSAALFQPVVLAATELVGHAVASVALPLLYVGGVLDVVGRVTPYRLGSVAALLRTAGLWVLGGLLTAFAGVIVVAGSLGPVSDGLTLKAGKFLANAFIPVVGKMFADAAEMVMGTSLVLKNAVGAVGLFALLVLLVVPVTKLLAMSLTYRLAGAAVAPVGAGAVPDILGSMGQTLVYVAIAVGAMAMMCFIALAALLAAGSAGVLP